MVHIGRKRLWVSALAALIVLLAAGLLIGRSPYLWFSAWYRDRPAVENLPAGYVDDASRLNRAHVAEVVSIAPEPDEAEAQLRALLARARRDGLRVAIAGARHSMGGHTIYPDGIVLDMLPFDRMNFDPRQQLLNVGAGCRWSAVLPYLESRGCSVSVMQSNDTFTVGGSISVNCHGWQHNRPPIASTVAGFRLMQADGTVVRCTREQNGELFSLVLGGYGLFGVILDVDLHVVPNERYRPESHLLASSEYVSFFQDRVRDAPDIGMAYGRLCVIPEHDKFLREAVLTCFRRAPCSADQIPALSTPALDSVRRQVHRAQIDSPAGKVARWNAETRFGEQFSQQFVSRNQLLFEEVEIYQEQNADRVDILQEYFVPGGGFEPFLDAAREIITEHRADLLNVTVRTVRADPDSFLRYADGDMFALVMLFNHERTMEVDHRMEAMTQQLIDAALACGGRMYLPYRLQETQAQLAAAYPQSADFFALRRRYDPDELFQNQFYVKYGRQAARPEPAE